MCKIIAIAGIKNKKTKKLWDLLIASVDPMTKNDKDGLGYAAISQSKGLFAERWINPKHAFKLREKQSRHDQKLLQSLKDSVAPSAGGYSHYGTPGSADTQAVILHSRMATCGVSIENTHPFIRDNAALIHNGVISNSYSLQNITSTCDSEVILNEYLESGVDRNPKKIQSVADALRGYYACAVLTQDITGAWVLDIFKDQRADLIATRIAELDATVFCTNAEILRRACKATGLTMGIPFKVNAGNLIRIDVATGNVIGIYKFEPERSYLEYTAPRTVERSNTTLGGYFERSLSTERIEEARLLSLNSLRTGNGDE